MFHCLCCLISMDGQRTLWAMKMMGTTFSRLILGVKEQRFYKRVDKEAPTCEQLCLSLAWPKNEVLCPSTEIKMNIFCETKIQMDRKTMFHCHCCLISMGGQAMPWAMKVTGITFTRFSLPMKKITIDKEMILRSPTKTWKEDFFWSLQKELVRSMAAVSVSFQGQA